MVVMRNLFGLLAKYPETGKVKTRLAQDIGADAAAKIYKIIAELIFNNTAPDRESGFERVIFYSPPEDKERFETWIPEERLLSQKGGDIGDIMREALKDLLESGAAKAVITGVDIPGVNRDIVKDAFLKLDNADVVIGPAEDGGYYLIGMKAVHPAIFRDISWSTGEVFNETVRSIEGMGLRYSTVKRLSDVDRIEDIIRHDNLLDVLCKNISERLL